jgi:predicted metalloprotease
MRWRRRARSGEIVDRRGQRSLGPAAIGAGVGLPGIVVFLLFLFLGGGDASTSGIDDVLGDLQGDPAEGEGLPAGQDPDARLVDFMSFVLDDVQNFWEDTFRQSGKSYERAELVLFTEATHSACGTASSQIGPHYCPPDQRVYIDLGFFRELRAQFRAPGDFAQAYVLAHEIGHHVQNLLGINERVRREQQTSPDAANELSVRLELQADCLAGVWAFSTFERDILESGDLEEGLAAAAAVGDDRIQRQAGADVNPETWTHGSSEQRVSWFRQGFEDGDPNACDTFSVERL